MKKILFSIVSLLVVWGLSAAPISEKQAQKIAADFFAQGGRSAATQLTLVWAGDTLPATGGRTASTNTEEPLLYIYNRGTTGFAIVAGDDTMSESVLAYSMERAFELDNMAPATRAIIDAWGKQIAAARNGNVQARQVAYAAYEEKLYETALWNQFAPFNNEAPEIEGTRAVTGCVATAMSIIAYYHKYPEKGVGTTPEYSYEDYNDGTIRTVPANTLGRTYDYANMLSDYNNGWTDEQGNAVAALMKDMGTSVKMQYNPSAWGGSGAFSTDVPVAMATYFGYSKQALSIGYGGKTAEEWQAMVRENIKTYGPTYFSGSSNSGGHAFVLDGYNADGYFRINYGWGGSGYGFYYLPTIEYYAGQAAVFYLEPDPNGTSTYQDYLTLLGGVRISSGGVTYDMWGILTDATSYQTGTPFTCLVGAVMQRGLTTFNGAWKLVVCNKEGEIKEDLYLDNSLVDFKVGYFGRDNVSVTITQPIESGDRIRAYYKGAYSTDWQWMLGENHSTIFEVLLKATPEEVAARLEVRYSKETNSFDFSSDLAIQYTVTNAQGTEVASGAAVSRATTSIDTSAFEVGEYTFSFASGGEPYKLTVVF